MLKNIVITFAVSIDPQDVGDLDDALYRFVEDRPIVLNDQREAWAQGTYVDIRDAL
ncbi:MAG: hypothetical protein HYX52_05620 [Chloroflexi bacterium]|nr:hypothetical protein [Chloroflexota bacterium]